MEDKSRVGSSRGNARLCPLKPKGRVKKKKEKKKVPPSRIQKLADAKGKRKVEGGTRFFLSVAWLTAPKRRALSDAGHTEQALLDCLVRKRSYRGLNLTFFAPSSSAIGLQPHVAPQLTIRVYRMFVIRVYIFRIFAI